MTPYNITTREEYEYAVSKGYEPMRDRHFTMDIKLRRELQKEKYPSNTEENNIKFYHYAWKIAKPKVCEECGMPLLQYSSSFISHICSRGAYPEMAYDLRNFNILCQSCHNKWENPITRQTMRIRFKNQKLIETLKREYERD